MRRDETIGPDDLVPLMAMLFWSHTTDELTEMFGKSRATLYRWRDGCGGVHLGLRPTMVKRLVQRSANMLKSTSKHDRWVGSVIRAEIPKIDKRPLERVSRQREIQRIIREYVVENPSVLAANVVAFAQEECEAVWKRPIDKAEVYRAVRNADNIVLRDGKFVLKATEDK